MKEQIKKLTPEMHEQNITCTIQCEQINDAMIYLDKGHYYICQNMKDGSRFNDLKTKTNYYYSWSVQTGTEICLQNNEVDNIHLVAGQDICQECERERTVINRANFTKINHLLYCNDCRDKIFIKCDKCGIYHYKTNLKKIPLRLESQYKHLCLTCYNEEFFYCYLCKKIHYLTDNHIYIENQGKIICQDCYEGNQENYFTCDHCSKIYSTSAVNFQDDEIIICHNCSDYYFRCSMCDTVHHNDYRYSLYNSSDICEDCRDSLPICDNCNIAIYDDDVYNDEDDNCLCPSCFNDRSRIKGFHNHDYKPLIKIHRSNIYNNKYIGLELEADCSSNFEKCVKDLYKISDRENLFYMKSDGSLDKNGIELVTHPCTLNFFKNKFPLKEVCDTFIKNDYLSHNSGRCGLHLHLNKSYFSNPDLSSLKLIYLFEKFWKEIVIFSRRKDFNFCNKNSALPKKLDVNEVKLIKPKCNKYGRYQAVNLCNDKTIELRVFRGTLKIETILATIEFCDFLMTIAEYNSIIHLQKINWIELLTIAKNQGYKNLIRYCQSKNLYPVDAKTNLKEYKEEI